MPATLFPETRASVQSEPRSEVTLCSTEMDEDWPPTVTERLLRDEARALSCVARTDASEVIAA